VSADTRDKMVVSTALLLREHGLTGTSVRDVIEHSGAPRGSIYHHFPDGKVQLVEEAVEFAGDAITAAINQLSSEGGDPVEAIHLFVNVMRHVLVSSDFRAGCPVVAVAAESSPDADEQARLSETTARVFADWTEALTAAVESQGVAPERAKSLATLLIASIEGAVVMCRAQRSTGPLDDVETELEALAKAIV
jgi:AcrR family transcriptional regulator